MSFFFSSGNFDVIPDSVVVQNYATTWSQGDTTWVDDKTADGSQDATLVNSPNSTTLSDGSEAIETTGSEYGHFPMPSGISGSGMSDFAIEWAFQYSTAQEFDSLWGVQNSGTNQTLEANMDVDGSGNSFNGGFRVRVIDGSNNAWRIAPSSNPNLDDGVRHDVTLSINDLDSQNATLIIDGSEVSLNYDTNQNPQTSNFADWDQDMGIWARHDSSGSYGAEFGASVGAFRWHKSSITSQTISDY